MEKKELLKFISRLPMENAIENQFFVSTLNSFLQAFAATKTNDEIYCSRHF